MTTRSEPSSRGGLLLRALVLSALVAPVARAQVLPTTGRVMSRLGPLELENGYPTDATVAKIFDDIDHQRACQAYLWALPLMAMQQWQSEHLAKFGAGKQEPVHERDRMMMGMLQPLGIEKGRPFNPTDRQKRILVDAAQAGEVMARAIAYQKRFAGAKVWPSRHWEISLFLAETDQESAHHTQLDERTSWFYEAVGVSVGMMGRSVGVGQVYLEAAKDSQGRWLDGGRTYRLSVPKDAPVAQFWSVTVYDNETRCFVKSGVSPDRSSRDAVVKNADGSVDLAFGPTCPAGVPESNWIKTLPGRGWFSYFRLYGPTGAYFDRSWELPDFEMIP